MKQKVKDYLKSIWYNPKHKAGFVGPKALQTIVKREGKYKIGNEAVKQWLQNQDAYSVRRQIHSKLKKPKIDIDRVDYMWDTDLADVSNLKKHNDGIQFLLVVIDTFSRYAWVKPLKDKKATTVLKSFKEILSVENKPILIRSDRGSEYVNRYFKAFCKTNGITHVESLSEHKAAFAESFIGKLKNIMYRYFESNQTYRYLEVLPDLIDAYNNRVHSALYGLTPSEIDEDTQYLVLHRMKVLPQKKHKGKLFKVGDQVRLTYKKRTFRRGYEQKWTEEIFSISHAYYRNGVPVYKVKDYDGEQIKGGFYGFELQKVDKDRDVLWKIEQLLKKKRVKGQTMLLVRWLGWPKKFDSWIAEKDLQNTTIKY